MPNWCSNAVRVTHSDPDVVIYVEAWLKYVKALGEQIDQPLNSKDEPIASPGMSNDASDKNRSEEARLYLEAFDQVWQIHTYDRDRNIITCYFTSRWGPPPDLYGVLEDMGCGVDATYLNEDADCCGVYENGKWTDYSLDAPDTIPDAVKRDFE